MSTYPNGYSSAEHEYLYNTPYDKEELADIDDLELKEQVGLLKAMIESQDDELDNLRKQLEEKKSAITLLTNTNVSMFESYKALYLKYEKLEKENKQLRKLKGNKRNAIKRK